MKEEESFTQNKEDKFRFFHKIKKTKTKERDGKDRGQEEDEETGKFSWFNVTQE